MGKKLVSVIPLLAVVAFAMVPAVAQAATKEPSSKAARYQSELFGSSAATGSTIPGGEQVPTITWGNLTLTGQQTGSEISCHNAIGGYVENPTVANGGGAGVG